MKFIRTVLAVGTVLGSVFAVVDPAFAQNWTKTSAPYGQWFSWFSVASSADGTRLVAAANSTLIYTSSDSGLTWISNSAPRWPWVSVASSADGTKLVAAANDGSKGPIYTSPDSGATWISNNVRNLSWSSVASSADGTKLVAAANFGPVYTSPDSGTTWATNSLPAASWSSVASSADGAKLVAVANNGWIYTSSDSGLTWIPNSIPRWQWVSVASSADGAKLVAAGRYGMIYTSPDSGSTWISNNIPRWQWASVASSADGTRLLCASAGSGQIYTSMNSGATWISNSVPNLLWNSVASSADGSKLVAVADAGGIYISQATLLPPLITVHPQNQSQPAGAEAIFTLTATGAGALGYQWQCNGTNLIGATNNILYLANVQPSQAGVYAVVVSNAFGTTVSSNAILVVGSAQPFTVIHSFDDANSEPRTLIRADQFYGCSQAGATVFSVNVDGSGFTMLHKLNPASGRPLLDLVCGGNVLYGAARQYDNQNYYGTVYSVGTDGSDFKILHNFGTNSADGIYPETVAFSGDTVYGATYGTSQDTLFSMNPDGSNFSVLRTFGAEGRPIGRLLPMGNLLCGTVTSGSNGGGAVFSVDTNGLNFTLIYNFMPGSTNGSYPIGNLIQSGDTFYGTTSDGGSYGQGVLFSLCTNGTGYTVLHSFTSAEEPLGFIALAVAGDVVYGVIEKNGAIYLTPTMFSVSINGTGFQIIHTFSDADGSWPALDLVSTSLLYSEGALYGIAVGGGYFNRGTLFKFQLPTIGISGISAHPDGSVTMNCSGYADRTYLMQVATNLTPPTVWQTVSTNVADTNGTWQFTDPNTGSSPARFYRLATP